MTLGFEATFSLEVVLCAALITAVITAVILKKRLTRREAQALEAERRAAASERLAELGAMTGGLAHEIKNPLSTVVLNAQLLREDIEEAELEDDISGRVVRRTNALEREAERLREILEDFLQFAGRMKLAATLQDARVIVDQLVDFFHPQCDRSGILLRADLQEGPIMARLDESLLKQAILNLLINALQAMEDEPDGKSHGELLIRLESDETSFRLHVIDQGEGITPERLEEIFHPYVSTKSGGSGLGLPTTRRIVEMHGGRIEVHSVPEQGSDFVIIMPLSGPDVENQMA
ncbi:MAG: two-component sensor histidine kinase [Planctomycetaceae bacterium]|mgnify:CR=1 FL=1|nr:two-component sensor histidine kinase [Planctomycetaceae bacterium]|tara:strand:- start:17 stop:889 length:873 start_codon:yes stop_codon:yes gene_type:complete